MDDKGNMTDTDLQRSFTDKRKNVKPIFCLLCSVIFFFLCSNAKEMPASVCDALKEVFQQEGGMSPKDAEQMLAAMERSGQFQSETWS